MTATDFLDDMLTYCIQTLRTPCIISTITHAIVLSAIVLVLAKLILRSFGTNCMMVRVCKLEWSRYAMHYNRKIFETVLNWSRLWDWNVIGMAAKRGSAVPTRTSFLVFFQRNIERQHICTTILLLSLWKGGCKETINGLLSLVA